MADGVASQEGDHLAFTPNVDRVIVALRGLNLKDNASCHHNPTSLTGGFKRGVASHERDLSRGVPLCV